MKLTRRDTHQLLLGGLALVAALPVDAAEDWRARLQAGLDALLPPDGRSAMSLTVYSAEYGLHVQVTAVVNLTWPPGHRRRRFEVSAPTEAMAVEALLRQIAERFAAALPDRLA